MDSEVLSITEMLIEAEMPIVTNEEGVNPIDMAMENKRNDIEELLGSISLPETMTAIRTFQALMRYRKLFHRTYYLDLAPEMVLICLDSTAR
jgi:hypothetical protein